MDDIEETEAKMKAEAKEKLSSFKDNADQLIIAFKSPAEISQLYAAEVTKHKSLEEEKEKLKTRLNELTEEHKSTEFTFQQLEQLERDKHDELKKESAYKQDCIRGLRDKICQLEETLRTLREEEASDFRTLETFEEEKQKIRQRLNILKDDKVKLFMREVKEKGSAIRNYTNQLKLLKEKVDAVAETHEMTRIQLEKFEATSREIGLSLEPDSDDCKVEDTGETVAQLQIRLADLKRQLDFVSTVYDFSLVAYSSLTCLSLLSFIIEKDRLRKQCPGRDGVGPTEAGFV